MQETMVKGEVGPVVLGYLWLADEQVVEQVDLWREVLEMGEELDEALFLLLVLLLVLFLLIFLFIHLDYFLLLIIH